MASLAVVLTTPVANTDTAPVPLPTALIAVLAAVTDPTVMAMPAPCAALVATIPSPATPRTDPFTLIDTAPPPALAATIAVVEALMFWPVADCVKVMPPVPPVCVSLNAVSFASTGVSEFNVTRRAVAPLAPRFWVA